MSNLLSSFRKSKEEEKKSKSGPMFAKKDNSSNLLQTNFSEKINSEPKGSSLLNDFRTQKREERQTRVDAERSALPNVHGLLNEGITKVTPTKQPKSQQEIFESSPATKLLSGAQKLISKVKIPENEVTQKVGEGLLETRKNIIDTRQDIRSKQADTTLGRFAGGFDQGASFGLSGYLDKLTGDFETPEKISNSTAGKIGEVAGYIAPGSAAYKATKLIKPISKIPNTIGRVATEGAVAGGLFEAVNESAQESLGTNDQSLKGRLIDVGIGAGLGAAGDLGISAIGAGLKATKNAATKAASDITANQLSTINSLETASKSLSTDKLPKNVKIGTKELLPESKIELPKELWHEKLFGRTGLGIAAGRGNVKELIDTHITRYAKEQSPIIERFKDSASVANQDYVDKLAPFHSISKETYDTAMDSTRANNLANVTIKDKFVDLEGNVRGKSLKEVYDIVPRGQKDLSDRYLIMRDAIDRMDRGIKVYGDKPWFPKTSQEAAERVAQMEAQAPWLRQFGEEWNQFNRNRQDLWVESGIASQDLIDTLRQSNPNYAPMQRQMPNRGIKNAMRGNQKEFSGQKAQVKRAIGSSRKIIEPAQSMINSTASSYHAMMRNRAMQKLYEAVVDNPEKYKGIIEIVPENDTMKQMTLNKINSAIEQDGLDGLADMLNGEIDSLFTKSKQASARPTDNHVTVMIGGNPVKMNVQEKSLLRAIEGVSPERLEGLLKLADNLSRAVKMSATGALAPLQGLKLFLRDIPIAVAQSDNKVRFLGDVAHAIVSQVGDWLPDFIPGTQNLGRLAREYYRAGGGYEQYLRGDSRIRATASDITRDPLLSGRNLWKQARKHNPFMPLKSLGDGFENVPRIAKFNEVMRKNGWSRDEATIREALNAAREATVNWSRKGARGQQIESVLPYSNAAVQGTYRMIKFMKEQPISALGLITAFAGASIGAYEKFKDDPDYQNRSKFSKGIPVYKTENGKFVTIPIEPNYQYIAEQILNFYKWAKDQEELPSLNDSIQDGLDAMTPKYIAGPISTFTGEKNIDPARGVATTLGGSSLEPLVATATGKNYFGGDIVPREYQSNSTPYQQNETTSAAANWASEHLGMDAFTFDYLAQKFGGDLAKVTLPMTSDVGKGDPLGNIYDETLSRLQLLEDPIMKNKLGDEWYKYADKVTQSKADHDKADVELPGWYQDVYDKVTSPKKGSIAKAISDLNTQKKDIQRDTTLTAKQRSEELRMVQSEINQLRIKGIEIMEKAGVLQ